MLDGDGCGMGHICYPTFVNGIGHSRKRNHTLSDISSGEVLVIR
jgi:hypothetical protein